MNFNLKGLFGPCKSDRPYAKAGTVPAPPSSADSHLIDGNYANLHNLRAGSVPLPVMGREYASQGNDIPPPPSMMGVPDPTRWNTWGVYFFGTGDAERQGAFDRTPLVQRQPVRILDYIDRSEGTYLGPIYIGEE